MIELTGPESHDHATTPSENIRAMIRVARES